MKRDYYEVLGVKRGATEEELKKAYRRLSSAHHPDKHTTASDAEKADHEAKFKEAKEAYEILSTPAKRQSYDAYGHDQKPQDGMNWGRASQSDIDEILRQMRRAHGMNGFTGKQKQHAEFNARVTLADAARGFEVDVGIPGRNVKVKVKPNTPDGYRTRLDVDENLTIFATTRIHDPYFIVKSAGDCGIHYELREGINVTVLESGHIEKIIEVDALDVLLGSWVDVSDHTGTKFSMRIPAGLQLGQKIKMAGKGYYHWWHELDSPSNERGDLYITVKPMFNGPMKLNKDKVAALLKAVEAAQPNAAV